MPLYDFVCSACGARVELLVASDANPDCPKCGQPKLERQLSLIASPNVNKSASTAPENCGLPQCGTGGG